MTTYKRTAPLAMWMILLASLFVPFVGASQRADILSMAAELERQAVVLAERSYDHFKGWSGSISDQEQAALFKSEAFSASCRLFLKLAEERTGYFHSGYARTNMHNAFTFLLKAFEELESEMSRAGLRPYELQDGRRILRRMEEAFARWPDPDNLAYLDQRYVKDRRAAVFLIKKIRTGVFVKHPFKNLESLYRYNYDQRRGKNPWDYLVEVKTDTLDKMERGETIDLNFEGRLVIEQSNRPNRPVYLIENGARRGLTSESVLRRYGGWNRVFEVPAEVINGYPEGEPIS